MTEHAIELRDLTKRFGKRTAVDGVSLKVPAGTVYGLVGPNGAGKTTLMRTMLGFTHATKGSARLLGQDMPASHASVYPQIGVIIEEPKFYPFMSGRDNLAQIAAARMPRITTEQIDRALATVDLADRADDRVKTYSLGMRQRLGVARALMHDPSLLILDEPSNGLDPPGIRDMRQLLRRLADSGKTVFVSSHILSEIELLCDHVAVLKDGVVIADGPTQNLASGGNAATNATTVTFRTADASRARDIASSAAGVDSATVDGAALAVTFTGAPAEANAHVAAVNRALVTADIDVFRIEHADQTLEERFLEIVDYSPEGGAS
jgi:ABC-2 type transport system ATP-binding protein